MPAWWLLQCNILLSLFVVSVKAAENKTVLKGISNKKASSSTEESGGECWGKSGWRRYMPASSFDRWILTFKFKRGGKFMIHLHEYNALGRSPDRREMIASTDE